MYITFFLTLSLAARRVVDARSLSRAASSTTRHHEAPFTLPRKYDYIFDNKSVERPLDIGDADKDEDEDHDDDSHSFNRRNSAKEEIPLWKRSNVNRRTDPDSILYDEEQPAAEHGTQRVYHAGPFEDLGKYIIAPICVLRWACSI